MCILPPFYRWAALSVAKPAIEVDIIMNLPPPTSPLERGRKMQQC